MNPGPWIAQLLGEGRGAELGDSHLSFAASWAHSAPAWLVLACVVLAFLAAVFYVRFQRVARATSRILLIAFRAALLCLLVFILAEPTLTFRSTSQLRPLLWLLFDGTDSMALRDDLPQSDRAPLAQAVGPISIADSPPADSNGSGASRNVPSRMEYLKALLSRPDDNLIQRLQERFRLRAFLFDRAAAVRSLEGSAEGDQQIVPAHLAAQLTADGQVTAIGAALADLARRQSPANLAGVVVFSDFNQNAGIPAVEAARRLGVNVHAVGIGPADSVDLAADLKCAPTMKKDERYPLVATLRQSGLDGQNARVRFFASAPTGPPQDGPPAAGIWRLIDQRDVVLSEPTTVVEASYVPAATGRTAFRVEVEPLAEELLVENNRAETETTVHDDFFRLLFVEYEPTWEWRFVKEVFHRDKLIGTRGFRTFLRSADPRVRQTNALFVPALASARSEFFTHDVILLGDLPASALSARFCEMTREFVDKLGGGLVVLAGPRFGPGHLAATPLADMLPVKVDPALRLRAGEPFRMRRTTEADQFDFMQLDATPAGNEKAWQNLGTLDWYQPVARLHPMATALAEHPFDKCVDGKTPQPLVSIRPYGRGEVVFLGFNELWRLRRLYGERYYRQFWGQLIHRLASRHALGTQKRFVVRTDRRQYQANDPVYLSAEVYDDNFQPLSEDKLPGRALSGEWILPGAPASSARPLSIPALREGLFETRFPALSPGEHRLRVRDPVTQEMTEVRFQVTSVSVERQQATRNTALERALADATGGRAYDLTTVHKLPSELTAAAKAETTVHVVPLWNTWPMFALVVLAMLGEWLGRKWVDLP